MQVAMLCFLDGGVLHVRNSTTMLQNPHLQQRFSSCLSTEQNSIVSRGLPCKLSSKRNGPLATKKSRLAMVCLGGALDRRALDGQGSPGVFERFGADFSVSGGSRSYSDEAGHGLQNAGVSSTRTAFISPNIVQKRPGEDPEGTSSWMNVLHSLAKGRGGRSLVPPSAGVELSGTDTGSYNKSRRRALLFSSLALILGANPYDVPGPSIICKAGRALSATVDQLSTSLDEAQSMTSDNGQRQKSAEDVKSWYKYRGEGFVLRIPPGYEDILDPGEEESRDSSSLYGEKAKDKPFAARFASPDRDEVLSIVVKRSSQLRLSFFEAQDISDFGNIKDAAATFVPAGAKIVSARIINSKASRVPRTYYVYEFLRQGTHFSLTAGVSKGRVFVLGASTPQAKWKDYSARLQLAAATFFLP